MAIVTRRWNDPPEIPCPRGCGADAWDLEQMPDGTRRIHFTVCRHGEPIEVDGLFTRAMRGIARWLRSSPSKEPIDG